MLVLFITRLMDSASRITTAGDKRMDSDAQARALLDRMAVDFAQMVKRSDVDFYLKTPAESQPGNDQLAFYSGVHGYSVTTPGFVSLIAYRINAQQQLERMAKGLVWNGSASPSTPMVFLPLTISATWPASTNNQSDPDYELIAPAVFRLEYSYLLRNGSPSITPWDTAANHTSVAGMQDTAAICVYIAAIDPKSSVLATDTQLAALAATMNDFEPGMEPGELVAQWQTAIDSTTNIPQAALAGARLYQRQFYLLPKP
jgi:hypothetical protein